MEDPQRRPVTIACGLEDLAVFLRSAGFAEAASLVELAALSARDEIAHAAGLRHAKEKDNPRRGAASPPHSGPRPAGLEPLGRSSNMR